MGIKATEAIPPAPNKPSYPLLARHRDTNMIVLLIKDGVGTVLSKGTSSHQVGHYGSDWPSLQSSCAWHILPVGTTITLEQE